MVSRLKLWRRKCSRWSHTFLCIDTRAVCRRGRLRWFFWVFHHQLQWWWQQAPDCPRSWRELQCSEWLFAHRPNCGAKAWVELAFGFAGAGLEGRSDGLGFYVRSSLSLFVMVKCAASVSRSTQIKWEWPLNLWEVITHENSLCSPTHFTRAV